MRYSFQLGEGAQKFALNQGFEKVSVHSLITEEAKRRLEQYKKFETAVDHLLSGLQSVPIRLFYSFIFKNVYCLCPSRFETL